MTPRDEKEFARRLNARQRANANAYSPFTLDIPQHDEETLLITQPHGFAPQTPPSRYAIQYYVLASTPPSFLKEGALLETQIDYDFYELIDLLRHTFAQNPNLFLAKCAPLAPLPNGEIDGLITPPKSSAKDINFASTEDIYLEFTTRERERTLCTLTHTPPRPSLNNPKTKEAK